VTGEGPAVASFPESNAKNYSNNAHHFALISRSSGSDFNFTRTFADTETEKDYYRGFDILDEAEKTRLRYYYL